jgi:hypothetical protein
MRDAIVHWHQKGKRHGDDLYLEVDGASVFIKTPAGRDSAGPAFAVSRLVTFDLVPVAGGPSVSVTWDIQLWVAWLADGTISVVGGSGLLYCA